MLEWKTMYRLKLRFFWPKMREEAKLWVKWCAHCVLYDVWRTWMSRLKLSWPLTVLFWIMHLDLWSFGHHNDGQDNKGYLMNSMFDITQFIILSSTVDASSVNFSQLFMSEIVLAFGMRSVVVVDNGSSFKCLCMVMCKLLDLAY